MKCYFLFPGFGIFFKCNNKKCHRSYGAFTMETAISGLQPQHLYVLYVYIYLHLAVNKHWVRIPRAVQLFKHRLI